MPILFDLIHRTLDKLTNPRWSHIILGVIAYFAIGYVMLDIAGEHHLTGSMVDFIYYMVINLPSAVVGDMSP